MCDSWTSMYIFLYVSWSGDDLGSYDGWGSYCKTSITSSKSVSSGNSCSQQWSGWSSSAQCQTGRQNQKFSH